MSVFSKKWLKILKLWAYAVDLDVDENPPKKIISDIYSKQVFRYKFCFDKKLTKK